MNLLPNANGPSRKPIPYIFYIQGIPYNLKNDLLWSWGELMKQTMKRDEMMRGFKQGIMIHLNGRN